MKPNDNILNEFVVGLPEISTNSHKNKHLQTQNVFASSTNDQVVQNLLRFSALFQRQLRHYYRKVRFIDRLH